jgi:hypothetical protein
MRSAGVEDEHTASTLEEMSERNRSKRVKKKKGQPATNAKPRNPRQARAKNRRKDDASATSVKIEDLPVIVSRRWYVTLSAVIGIVGSIITGTYFVVDYGRIKPIEKDLKDNRTLLASAKSDALSAKSQLERAEQRNGELAAKFDRPVQIFPRDRSSVVGSNISFLWDYGKHDASTQYILELQDMTGRAQPIKLNVDRPETKSLFYAFEPAAAGSYVWWVRPGRIVSEGEVGQGPWSPPAVFTIYPNVTERIRATGKLLIASTPTSYDMGVNNKGEYGGFEIKVLRWLAPRLAEKLKWLIRKSSG